MNPFFAYLIKSSISLAVLYYLFRFVMRNDRNHALNRFLLLGILLISSIIPFLNIQFFYEEVAIKQVEVFREFVSTPVFSDVSPQEITQPVNKANSFSINPWLAFYILIIVALLSRISFGVFQVTQIINRAEKRRLRKIVLAVVQDLIQPFTFLNKVVLSEKDFTENKDIVVAHEHAHIKQMHAIDLMLCELFTVVHFFNPFMWLLRRDLKLIHEYQADQAVLNKGIDAKKYQLLVLQKSVGERRFAMANHFTQKPILKRLKMMQQKNRKQWTWVKIILFLPLLVLLLQAFSRPELITNKEDFISIRYMDNQSEKWLQKWSCANVGKGIYEPKVNDIDAPRKSNNVLVILMNARNQYLVENQYPGDSKIKQIVKDYLYGINPDGRAGPDYVETEIPELGKIKVSKGIISYRYDIASSKEMVNKTLRDIGEACLEVRNEKSRIFFDKNYFDLTEEKREAIDKVVPVWFTNENPKGPTPSVWLPFDKKPSPDPKPIKIEIEKNGKVFVGDHVFNTFEEFEENLKSWNTELDEFNKDRRSKGYFRAHVTYTDISRPEQKEISYLLYKNNVHIEHISSNVGYKRITIHLKADGKEPDLETIRKKALKDRVNHETNIDVLIQYAKGVSEEQIISVRDVFLDVGISKVEVKEYTQASPPLFLMRLYPHEIQNVFTDAVSINDVSEYAGNWLQKVGSEYSACIYAYQNVSEDRILELKKEMKNGGIQTPISVRNID